MFLYLEVVQAERFSMAVSLKPKLENMEFNILKVYKKIIINMLRP